MKQPCRGRAGSWIAIALSVPLLAAGCTPKVSAAESSSTSPAAAQTSTTSAAPALDLATLTPEQLLNRARLAASQSDNLHVTGGGNDGSESVAFDLAFGSAGSSGTISIDALPITLLSRDGQTWFKATPAFWKAQAGSKAAAIVATVNGRWVKADPGDKTFKDLTAMADRQELLDQFLTLGGSVTRAAPATVDGTECLAVSNPAEGTLYVARSDGRPIQVKGNYSADGVLDFDYSPVTIPDAPSSAEVIDSAKIGG